MKISLNLMKICSRGGKNGPIKTEDINVQVFNMITGINESETLIKHISYTCKGKFDCIKCNSKQKWNKNKRQCEFVKSCQ